MFFYDISSILPIIFLFLSPKIDAIYYYIATYIASVKKFCLSCPELHVHITENETND